MINSADNQHLKQVRKLARRRERDRTGLFVAEGEDLLRAATAAKWPAVVRLVAAAGVVDGGLEVEPALLAAVSSLGSGTRALGVFEQRWGEPRGPLCVYLHGVADPGNVGTILRSAAAFGASCVALGPGSADPYSPKAVRASMGAVFSVPVARVESVGMLPGHRLALLCEEGEPLAQHHTGALSVLVGAEREGLPAEIVEACDSVAWIPTEIDSLNAAMATTVALYELTRHRMAAP